MITTVNPGSTLTLEGSFELAWSLAAEHGARDVVWDTASGRIVTLAGLLRSFLDDPEETHTGLLRITIEAASIAAAAR